VRVTVRRSDIAAADPVRWFGAAHVGVFTEGYGLVDGFTDAPATSSSEDPRGTISILPRISTSPAKRGVEVDLHPDSTIDQTLHAERSPPVRPCGARNVERLGLLETILQSDPRDASRPARSLLLKVSLRRRGTDGRFTYEGIPCRLREQAVTAFRSTRAVQHRSRCNATRGRANALNLVISSTQPQGNGTMPGAAL